MSLTQKINVLPGKLGSMWAGYGLADRAVKILGDNLAVEVDDLDLHLIRRIELLQGVGA